MNTNLKVETTPKKPEWIGCNEGYVFYTDTNLLPRTVRLYSEDGVLLAIVMGVHHMHLAPLPRS